MQLNETVRFLVLMSRWHLNLLGTVAILERNWTLDAPLLCAVEDYPVLTAVGNLWFKWSEVIRSG